ncbi:MAG: inner-rane translocator, partial [Deltaproteobacteria bacterium]|nr:inner-rane translocator [Deltaproteobacteria bacterium]
SIPLYLPEYIFYLLNLMLVHAIIVVGYNILAGNTGQISLGHAGFFAIGAYGTTLLIEKLGIPFIPALVLSGFIAAFFGFIVGLPALKLEGPYLSIATLAFGLAIMHVIGHVEMFGGRTGIETPPLDLGIPQWGLGCVLSSDTQKYWLFLIVAILMVVGARNIMKTRVGRSFSAIRDSTIAAEVTGINLLAYKTLAFAVSAFYAGIAGGLFGFVLPQSLTVPLFV